jgi:hypothetical protein
MTEKEILVLELREKLEKAEVLSAVVHESWLWAMNQVGELEGKLAQKPIAHLWWVDTPAGKRLEVSRFPNQNDAAFPVYAAPPRDPACKWPTCHSVEYQQALVDDVAGQLVHCIPAPRGFIQQPSIDGTMRIPTDWSAA